MPYIHTDDINLYSQFYEVRRRLAEVSASYWVDLEIYNYLNQGQQDIAIKSRCLKKWVTVTTTAGTETYDLKTSTNPFADIIDISEDGVYFDKNGSSKMKLIPTTEARLDAEHAGWRDASNSVPWKYYYNKSSKTIGLYPKPNSSNAGAYLYISGYYKPKILNAGTAAAATATTLTLATGSSTVPYPHPSADYYNNLYIEIYSGTGAGQKKKITDYASSVCTVAWDTTPNTASVYGMIPEIPSEAQPLMILYALGRLWAKGGTRKALADNYMQQYYAELNLFINDFNDNDDEVLIKESYRA